MYYLIWIPAPVERLGITADSEFQLPVSGKKREWTLAEYVRRELGLHAGEWEVI